MNQQILKNQRGQTLIEYLIIVALVGVGSIALVRAVANNVNYRFGSVVKALGGTVETSGSAKEVSASMLKNHDMKNFLNGVREGKKQGSDNDSDSAE
jgi:Flp pilus assembly pilin Flp